MTKHHSHRPAKRHACRPKSPRPPQPRVRHSHRPGAPPYTRPSRPRPRIAHRPPPTAPPYPPLPLPPAPAAPRRAPPPGPIYFHHIRKTGGTSLVFSFLALAGDPQSMYKRLCNGPMRFNDKLFRGWDPFPSLDTFFAWSHNPAWQVKAQEDAFTITVFRDPVARLRSHYRQVLLYDGLGRKGMPLSKEEYDWLGQGMLEFVGRVPKESQQRQLYMFSPDFDIEQAAEYARSLSCCLHLSDFDRGVVELGQLLKVDLETYHVETIADHAVLKQTVEAQIQSESTPEVEEALWDLLRPEYELLEELSKAWKWENWREPA